MYFPISAIPYVEHGLSIGVLLTLLWVAIDDIRAFRITNIAVLVLLSFAIAKILVLGTVSGILPLMAFAGVMFAVMVGLYSANMLGGGDAKLLSVAFLWFGPSCSVYFAVLLFMSALAYVGLRRWTKLPTRITERGLLIPYGPPIALSWAGAQIFLC